MNRPSISRKQAKIPGSDPRDDPPATPPMMRKGSYDQDAHASDFGDTGFFDDDEGAENVDVGEGMSSAAVAHR